MKTSFLIGLILVVLVGAYQFFKPKTDSAATAIASSAKISESFVLEINNGDVIGKTELTVSLGQSLEIHITSSSTDELHLHGYDITAQVQANVPSKIKLTANKAGRFPLELHKAHREIAVLIVQP